MTYEETHAASNDEPSRPMFSSEHSGCRTALLASWLCNDYPAKDGQTNIQNIDLEQQPLINLTKQL